MNIYGLPLSAGFGNLSPRTKWGQLFCVCYALVGIPMFGFLLAGVGDHMGTGLWKAVWKMETLFLVRLSSLSGCFIYRMSSHCSRLSQGLLK